MVYKLLDLMCKIADILEAIADWIRQKALYNRWTTCPYCLIENGYGHKFDCPMAKGDGDDGY